jgi:hypothetical protein
MKIKKFPVKYWIIALLLVIWFLLVIMDISQEGINNVRFGLFSITAAGIIDLFLILTIISRSFKDFILRKGHTYKEIKFYVNILFVIITLFIITLILSVY